MELWIKPTNTSAELCSLYADQISKHNKKVVAFRQGLEYADSGFDLYIPRNPDHSQGNWVFPAHTTVRIPLGIKMINLGNGHQLRACKCIRPTLPYYIYARSSISKMPLRLANNQGIIDAGYRGELMVALDNTSVQEQVLNPGIRLVQVCQADLIPFTITIVNEDFENTERGSGGFGSTGR